MLEMGLRDFKKKALAMATKAQVFVGENLPVVTEFVGDFVETKVPQMIHQANEIVQEKAPVVEQAIAYNILNAKENLDLIINHIQSKRTMEHQILMMGGRRAGKSTILSSILHVLKEETPGSLCTIEDKTDYDKEILGKDGKMHKLMSLDKKRLEVSNYIKKHKGSDKFLVNMTPTLVDGSYVLRVSTENTSINLEFVDVPGEWMEKTSDEHAKLKEKVMGADVFVIAIDTPFLMQDDSDVNDVYNRANEITDAIGDMNVNPSLSADKRLILLCPVKCEKWVRVREVNNKKITDAHLVNERVKKVYKNLINRWLKFPNVDIWIMPIQTVGGLDSACLLPAKLYFKDTNDTQGTPCSLDEETQLLIDKDGNMIDPDDIDRVEDDYDWEIDYTTIPLSWYKNNGLGFHPVDCEQPGFRILEFLVDKEESMNRNKAEIESIKYKAKGWLSRIFIRLFNPTFGMYLPKWKAVIDTMHQKGLLKSQGDGFEKVTNFIE